MTRLAFVALALLSFAGCGPATPAGAAAPEQRSVAEYDLAREAFGQGRAREALAHIETSLKMDGNNAEAAYLGAVLHLSFCARDEASPDCRFADAERYARKALEAAPEMREAKNTLGVILVHERKYDEAITVLRALANDIQYASPEKAWGNLGWAYLMGGRPDDAIDALRRATAAQPLFCVGHYRLGLAYAKRKEHELAVDSFSRALDVPHPECQRLQDAYEARGHAYASLGEQTKARGDYEKCAGISKATPAGKRCNEALH
jgi:type IV pilus assembly protein PilF